MTKIKNNLLINKKTKIEKFKFKISGKKSLKFFLFKIFKKLSKSNSKMIS